jgi:hypothetical protein
LKKLTPSGEMPYQQTGLLSYAKPLPSLHSPAPSYMLMVRALSRVADASKSSLQRAKNSIPDAAGRASMNVFQGLFSNVEMPL